LQKLTRRLKEEPLIPLGCILTCAALVGASRSIRSGDRQRTNRMFRARVYAQGFTILAMVAGSVYWKSDRQKRKEFDLAVAERIAKEKREAWVRELEARDEEAKELRAWRERRMQGGGPVETMEKAREKTKGSVKKAAGENQTQYPSDASSVSAGKEPSKGIMETVQGMIWGRKK
jgi:hypothetical protein